MIYPAPKRIYSRIYSHLYHLTHITVMQISFWKFNVYHPEFSIPGSRAVPFNKMQTLQRDCSAFSGTSPLVDTRCRYRGGCIWTGYLQGICNISTRDKLVVFILVHPGMYIEQLTFIDISRVWVADDICSSIPFGYIYNIHIKVKLL